MDDEKRYSFISVQSADDDEVIQAGCSPKQPAPDAPTQTAEPVTTPVVQQTPSSSGSVQQKTADSAAFASGNVDIDADADEVPFGRMRIIILILALLFIAGFVVYYLLLPS